MGLKDRRRRRALTVALRGEAIVISPASWHGRSCGTRNSQRVNTLDERARRFGINLCCVFLY